MERENNLNKSGQMQTAMISHESAFNVLNEEINSKDFIPEGVWITQCTEPCKPLPSNHKLMMKENSLFVTRMFSDDSLKESKIPAMSFCNNIPCSSGLRHQLDFYPHTDFCGDKELLVEHAKAHLKYLAGNYADWKTISFSVIIPDQYAKCNMSTQKILRELGLPEFKEDKLFLIEGHDLS